MKILKQELGGNFPQEINQEDILMITMEIIFHKSQHNFLKDTQKKMTLF